MSSKKFEVYQFTEAQPTLRETTSCAVYLGLALVLESCPEALDGDVTREELFDWTSQVVGWMLPPTTDTLPERAQYSRIEGLLRALREWYPEGISEVVLTAVAETLRALTEPNELPTSDMTS